MTIKRLIFVNMISRTNFGIYPLLIMAVFLAVASSCRKDDDSPAQDPINSKATNGRTTAVFGTLTDQDGNVYKTVTIGTQTWMAENLRTTIYNDGTAIPNVTNNKWGNLKSGAYWNYGYPADTILIATYGPLYNWYTVNTGKLAPKGWHVPTYSEWLVLIDYLGGEDVASRKLKESGATHWYSAYFSGNNVTGFTALPGGGLPPGRIGMDGYWWSATKDSDNSVWSLSLDFDARQAFISKYPMGNGCSVRCVRD